MIGIYRIKNLKNKKCYYGSSKNIEKRWRTHSNNLKNGKHHNIHLQRSWDKYGEDNFVFELVEECNETILLENNGRIRNVKMGPGGKIYVSVEDGGRLLMLSAK